MLNILFYTSELKLEGQKLEYKRLRHGAEL